ncbi:MAG: YCF48-related protein, partial [Pyrinomonadaceae bacterium]
QVLVAGETQRPLLLETTDSGDSWKELTVAADIRPSSVCFVGDKGWLAGSQRIINDEEVKLLGVLLLTEDAGKSWSPVQFGPEEPFFTDVRFTDPTHGWLVGRDSLYTTADGGKTWRQVLNLP